MKNERKPQTLRELESQICELRSMAAIADHLLDDLFEEALQANRQSDDDQPVVLSLWREDIDKFSFAYKQVLCMATDLKRDFYEAYDG